MASLETRCTHRTRDGRRCRMLCAGHPTLCPYHLRKELREAGAAPPAPPSLVAPGALDNPWAVRRALKHLIREVFTGRLSPDQARVLARLGSLLLISTRRARRARVPARTLERKKVQTTL